MGNKFGRKRQVVEERYTKPQGLYLNKDVDSKKLRKLILESKLAPCYPGDEESGHDREECPICFLFYPSLNRSRCCMKSICTECFLQMKNPNSVRPTQCPFCKTSNYAVEYRGVKTKEEKSMEQIEEQRVIEAQIRMRQKEVQDEEERMQKRLESCSSSTSALTVEMESCSVAATSYNSPSDDGEIASYQDACAESTPGQPLPLRGNGNDEFDIDLEDIMVMEAIWLSVQENGMNGRMDEVSSSAQHVSGGFDVSPSMAPIVRSSSSSSQPCSSPSSGLACTIAALAERQRLIGDSSRNNIQNVNASSYNMLPGSCTGYYNNVDQEIDGNNYINTEATINVSMNLEDARTSYTSSDMSDDDRNSWNLPPPPPPPPPPLVVPESFDEQMMLAMAFSLAEATSTSTGAAWQ